MPKDKTDNDGSLEPFTTPEPTIIKRSLTGVVTQEDLAKRVRLGLTGVVSEDQFTQDVGNMTENSTEQAPPVTPQENSDTDKKR